MLKNTNSSVDRVDRGQTDESLKESKGDFYQTDTVPPSGGC